MMASSSTLTLAGLLLLGLVGLALSSEAEAPLSPARLLVEKKVLNRYLVESRDLVIAYNIFNIGENTASDVSVTDLSFPSENFEVISGLLKFVVPRVEPRANVTHTVVLRPRVGVWGRFNFTSADVKYHSVEGTNSIQVGFTSAPGEGFIIPERQFDRQFSPHYLDWAAFAVMSLPSLLFPFLLWNKSKSHYEAIAKQKVTKRQ